MTDTEIHEPLAAGMTRVWRLGEVLHSGHTEYQQVTIARTAQGIALFCDDDRQSTEFSQLVYHEALVVPALLLASRLDRVLIIGSSEGVASQMAAAAGAGQVDHVDIDAEAVRLCARHLPYGYTPSDMDSALRGDGTIRLHRADGWQFVRDAAPRGAGYDVIVVDLPDEREGGAQHNRLYGKEFLAQCRSALAPGGVVAYQAGCPTLWRNATLLRSWQRFTEVFDTCVYFGSDEHEWSFLFGLASPVADPTAAMIERLGSCRYRPRSIDTEALRGATVPPHALRHAPHTREVR
ncbi:MAG: spermidine synthase [Sciscionella sp.]